MYAVIMAGGEGKRLRPFTHSIPKPLLPIGRKPVAQLIIERLRQYEITDIIISLGYSGDLIRAYFQDGRQFGVRITYYQETSKLGTAGCLACLPMLREDDFLVTNGDILSHVGYDELVARHRQSQAALTAVTRVEEIAIPYGVLTLVGDSIRKVEEKPRLRYCFNAGIYALSPEALNCIPSGQAFDMTDLMTALLAQGKSVQSYELEGLWFDLGRVDDFEKALAYLEQTNPELL